MKILVLAVAMLVLIIPCAPQQDGCATQDSTRFINAKTAIAKEVLKQENARLAVCEAQPRSKRPLCADWAQSANEAAHDIELTAFAQIDKIMIAAKKGSK